MLFYPQASIYFEQGINMVQAQWSIWLKSRTIKGLSGIKRIGDTTYTGNLFNKAKDLYLSTSLPKISGTVRASDLSENERYAAAVGVSRSEETFSASATIDHVDIEYEIEACVGCSMTLTKLDITVGKINVSTEGLGVLGEHLSEMSTLASNAIKEWIVDTFKGVVATKIQNVLDVKGPFTSPFVTE